jgi:hypothetical protein
MFNRLANAAFSGHRDERTKTREYYLLNQQLGVIRLLFDN